MKSPQITTPKLIKTLKIFTAVGLAALGWGCLMYGFVAADMVGASYGAVAVVLFQISAFYMTLAVILGVDLYGSRKDNPILTGNRLTVSLSIAGFLSTVPMAISVFPADSPIVAVYAVLAAIAPFAVKSLVTRSEEKEAEATL